jgi:hypothetical protein
MITTPALADPPMPMAGPYGAPAVTMDERTGGAETFGQYGLPMSLRHPAKQVTCLDLVRTMQVAAKLVPPSNFMTHVIDEAMVKEMSERLVVIADKALYPMRGGAWGGAMKLNKLTALQKGIAYQRSCGGFARGSAAIVTASVSICG